MHNCEWYVLDSHYLSPQKVKVRNVFFSRATEHTLSFTRRCMYTYIAYMRIIQWRGNYFCWLGWGSPDILRISLANSGIVPIKQLEAVWGYLYIAPHWRGGNCLFSSPPPSTRFCPTEESFPSTLRCPELVPMLPPPPTFSDVPTPMRPVH